MARARREEEKPRWQTQPGRRRRKETGDGVSIMLSGSITGLLQLSKNPQKKEMLRKNSAVHDILQPAFAASWFGEMASLAVWNEG